MAVPMLAGTIAINAYNLADTYFVSRLGTLPLAAMGFTFPVTMLFTFITGGIGTGVTTLTSHALGKKDFDEASRLVTHGIILVVAASTLLAIAGYLSIDTVFSFLGADGSTLPLIGEFMRVWYTGALLMAFPMMGNGILISTGDSLSASLFILLGTGLNVILDPVMIFGLSGCPPLGIGGAALATVISQAVSTFWLFLLLGRKHRLLRTDLICFNQFLASSKKILSFAIPAIISMMLAPLSSTVLTMITSSFGREAVAACGAATRLEMFAFVIPMALGISLTPFVSQNFGAGRPDRVREAKSISTRFAIIYGAIIAVLFFIYAPFLAAIFTDDPAVERIIILYVRTVSFGYGMMEVHRYSGFILTGIQKPLLATTLNAVRVLLLLIPLSFLGAHLGGINGLFFGRLISDIFSGLLGLLWVSRLLTPASRVCSTTLTVCEKGITGRTTPRAICRRE